ncbi:MAG: RNA pseudouridine synthase [Clostridia bacterium]|nr:RNA pseudouridine synthase [Clostridia bacterium]
MQVLFKNKDLAVIIKPVGLDSEKGVPDELKNAVGGEIFTVHRLDKNVSGIMVYARNKSAAAELSRAVIDGSMIKEYLALVHGDLPERGDWEDLLFKDSTKNKVFVVKRERRGVKSARLEFKKLRGGETSLAEIRLHTGRSHQIRVQFASRGFPLVGDGKYGAKDNLPYPMLFSFRITFPFKGKNMSFESKPQWFKEDKNEA